MNPLEVIDIHKDDIVVLMPFGSHLYGTATKDSDEDYKGVFLPTAYEVLLGRIPRHRSFNTKSKGSDEKNTRDDADIELYSIHYFIKLACGGETAALDMLHCPENQLLVSSDVWTNLLEHRHKFYTKSLKTFVGYCKKQAAKYGIKGSRLKAARKVVKVLRAGLEKDTFGRMRDVWHQIEEGEHVKKFPPNANGVSEIEVCGKKVQDSVTLDYARNVFENYVQTYGKRAELAARNEGLDWKALSHAVRAALQVRQILTENTIVFPLPEAEFLIEVKKGEVDYAKEVAPYLEGLIAEIEELSSISGLPEKVDRSVWDQWLVDVMWDEVLRGAQAQKPENL